MTKGLCLIAAGMFIIGVIIGFHFGLAVACTLMAFAVALFLITLGIGYILT